MSNLSSNEYPFEPESCRSRFIVQLATTGDLCNASSSSKLMVSICLVLTDSGCYDRAAAIDSQVERSGYNWCLVRNSLRSSKFRHFMKLSGWNVENRSGIRQNSFYPRNGISGEIHYTLLLQLNSLNSLKFTFLHGFDLLIR